MLIQCPECKREVSDKAKFCPQCGYPIEENTLEYKVGQIIREDSPIKAICFLEDKGWTLLSAKEYVDAYMESHPGCNIKKKRADDVLRCPRCGSTDVKKMLKYVSPDWIEEGIISAYDFDFVHDYRCNKCWHAW